MQSDMLDKIPQDVRITASQAALNNCLQGKNIQ